MIEIPLPGLPSLDLGLLAAGRDYVLGALKAYLFATKDLGGGDFTHARAITALVPWTRGLANLGLVAVLTWGSFHVMWGHGVRSRYTVRILLPRFLLAIVLINFSLPLIQAAIDFNNALCDAVWAVGLPFSVLNTFFNKDELGGVPTVPILVTAALFISYLVLAIGYIARFALLLVLAATSPLAALFFVLPDTQHYARAWGSLFTSTLLMQPAQMLIIGIGFQLEQASGQAFLRHWFALATVMIAFKVPGALHATATAGSHTLALGRHFAHEVSHMAHAR
jgi:hypothetical protein